MGMNTPPEPSRGELLPVFAELVPTLDTGDVLLFGGEGRFARTLKRVMRCRWSHVALVARPHRDGPLLLWEATDTTDLPDVVTREMTGGVILHELEVYLRHYAEETAIRKLNVERTDEMRAALLRFYEEASGRPYKTSTLEMIRAMTRLPRLMNRKADTSSFFCSQLVAEAYQRMGLLPSDPPSNAYTPKDFSTRRRGPLRLLRGATLGPEVLVCRVPGG